MSSHDFLSPHYSQFHSVLHRLFSQRGHVFLLISKGEPSMSTRTFFCEWSPLFNDSAFWPTNMLQTNKKSISFLIPINEFSISLLFLGEFYGLYSQWFCSYHPIHCDDLDHLSGLNSHARNRPSWDPQCTFPTPYLLSSCLIPLNCLSPAIH